MKLVPVAKGDIDSWGLPLRKWADYAGEHSGGRYNGEYLIEMGKKGNIQLWVVMEDHVIYAFVATEIRQFPNLREFIILITTGDGMEKWASLVESLEGYAKALKCDKFTAITRPGWEKILKPFGFAKTHVQLEKEIC